MKFIAFCFLLCVVSPAFSQDFSTSPYQDFSLDAPVVGDFDNDGKVDILAIQYSFSGPNKVVLQLNNGISPITYAEKDLNLSFNPVGQPAVVDLDGDNDLDVVIAEKTTNLLFLLKNDGAANFTLDSLNISGVYDLKVVDIDNDQDWDIVGLNASTHNLRLFVNDGTNHFSTKNILTNAANLSLFDLGDFDQNGFIDIAAGYDTFTGKQIAIYKNNGSNSFNESVVVYDQFSSISDLKVDDINGDGKQDIIAIKFFNCDGFINNGDMTFTDKSLVSASGLVNKVNTGDFNGDGKKDLVIGFNSINTSWYKNLSNSTLQFEAHNVGSVSPVYFLVVADLDGDNDQDLVVSNDEFWWYENTIPQEHVSTNELKFFDNAVLLPNPVSDYFSIQFPDLGKASVEITDVYGKQLLQVNEYLSNEKIDISDLNIGAYFAKINCQNCTQGKSFLFFKGK